MKVTKARRGHYSCDFVRLGFGGSVCGYIMGSDAAYASASGGNNRNGYVNIYKLR
jgi:hypothetical protein